MLRNFVVSFMRDFFMLENLSAYSSKPEVILFWSICWTSSLLGAVFFCFCFLYVSGLRVEGFWQMITIADKRGRRVNQIITSAARVVGG